jgi:hypothetical protein
VPIIDAQAHWYLRAVRHTAENEGDRRTARKMGRDTLGNTVVQSVPGGTQASTMP